LKQFIKLELINLQIISKIVYCNFMVLKPLLKTFQRMVYILNYLFSTQLNETKFYKKYLSDKEVIVFDIGSNLGTFSQQLSKTFPKKLLEIHSFEPIDELLAKQKIKNGMLHKHNYIISEKSGLIDFFEHEISSQSSVMLNEKIKNQKVKKLTKEAITLEQALEKTNISKVDLLKLDTEGNELDILKSSEHLLKQKIFKIIKVEISFFINNKFTDKNFHLINALMHTNGYVYMGHSNAHYQDNKILFFDSFYINNNLLS